MRKNTARRTISPSASKTSTQVGQQKVKTASRFKKAKSTPASRRDKSGTVVARANSGRKKAA